jgi:hypothetical protein
MAEESYDVRQTAEDLSSAQRDHREATGRIATIEREIAELATTTASSDHVDVNGAREAVAKAREVLEHLQKQHNAWTQAQSTAEREKRLTALRERYRTLKIDGQKAIKTILAERTEAFCRRVTAYLPRGWEFGVMVDDDGRDVFMYGLYENSDHGPYLKVGLSEGQRVVVLAALCSVLLDLNPVPLAIIVLPDRGWSRDVLGTALDAMAKIPHHVIITTTTEPPKDRLGGWTVHRCSWGDVPPVPREHPELPDPTEVNDVTATPVLRLDEMLMADPFAMPSSRARGGKFRAVKTRVLKEVEKHDLASVMSALLHRHEHLQLVPDTTAEELAETMGHYLFPQTAE